MLLQSLDIWGRGDGGNIGGNILGNSLKTSIHIDLNSVDDEKFLSVVVLGLSSKTELI